MSTTSSFTRVGEWEQLPEPALPDSLVDAAGNPDIAAIRAHPDFVNVRRRLTRFVFPMAGAFLVWYLTYVLLAAYASDFMGKQVFENVTVGLLLGLSQFVSTVVIMLLYVRFARRNVDPAIASLRERAGVGES
jgi:uncharacterized membrane protein (DUF485 family)